MSKVLVTGSRDWSSWDRDIIRRELFEWAAGASGPITLVHGGARGVDSIAGDIAKEAGWTVRVYEADWEQHGKAAGPIRNRDMLCKEMYQDSSERLDLVLAFSVDLEKSKGTKDMVFVANRHGIPVKLVSS